MTTTEQHTLWAYTCYFFFLNLKSSDLHSLFLHTDNCHYISLEEQHMHLPLYSICGVGDSAGLKKLCTGQKTSSTHLLCTLLSPITSLMLIFPIPANQQPLKNNLFDFLSSHWDSFSIDKWCTGVDRCFSFTEKVTATLLIWYWLMGNRLYCLKRKCITDILYWAFYLLGRWYFSFLVLTFRHLMGVM